MATLSLTIETGNDAVRTVGDLFEIVMRFASNGVNGQYADQEDDVDLIDAFGGVLKDSNGNTVGAWHVV